MNKPTPIALAVHLALSGAGAAPALLATGVGIAHGRVPEPIARCQQGQEVAACASKPVAEEPELHLDDIVLPREPEPGIAPPPGNLALQGYAPTITRTDLPPADYVMGTPLPLLVSP